MVLVSIFISNRNHFCVLYFRLATARTTPLYDVLKYWAQYAKDVRTDVQSYSAVSMFRHSGAETKSRNYHGMHWGPEYKVRTNCHIERWELGYPCLSRKIHTHS